MIRFSTLLVLLSIVECATAQKHPLFSQLKLGDHAIGFRELYTSDSSRSFASSPARPMQIGLWYPANDNIRGNEMTVQDYFALDYREIDSSTKINDSLRQLTLQKLTRHGANQELVGHLLQSYTLATRGAKPGNENYPLLIFAQGGGRPARSAFLLGEYFASHGYVVITMPHIGKNSQKIDRGVLRVEEQVKDIDFLYHYASQLDFVDVESTILMAFSTGAESLFLHQANYQRAKAIVTFDGGPNRELLEEVDGFDAFKINIPVLFVSSNHGMKMTIAEAEADRYVAGALHNAQKYTIKMMELNHPGLLTIGMMESIVPKLTRFQPIGNTGESHIKMLNMVRRFSAAVLNEEEIKLESSPRAVFVKYPD